MEIERDNLDYALSQYADGTLNELDRRVVDERLIVDAEARLLLSDFYQVDRLLRDSREVPEIDFDVFAAGISRAIDGEEAYAAAPLRMRTRWLAPLAATAMVAIGAVAGLQWQASKSLPAVASGTAVITGPVIETAGIAPTITIGVGPSESLARRGDTLSLGDEAIAPPSPRVVISSATTPSKDEVRPY